MRIRALVSVIFFGLFSFACGHSPVGPDEPPTPSSVSIRIIDGLTNQPILANGTVEYVSDNGAPPHFGHSAPIVNGSAQIQVNRGDALRISGISQYRDRNTLYCGQTDFTLWMNRPDDVDDGMTAFAYYNNVRMIHPSGNFINIFPNEEIQADSLAMANIQMAANRVMEAVNGRTVISVTSSSNQPNTFKLSINPDLPPSAGARTTYTSLTVSYGGLIEFKTIPIARNLYIAMHEIIHSLGLNEHNPRPGLMNAQVSSDLTLQEKHLLLLRYTRPTEAQFGGDDDTRVRCP